ncbi:MAG TPA: PASTA domain-containing protein [Streptosporangiaceae bacterium]|nr:PASTA domain-containing protein [Streptosporangiaceae bacterium]
MDTTLASPPIGQVLDGRYRVESLIARGGMATVYQGTDTRLDRRVALKIMHADLASDEDFVRRFVDEARSVARLSHPNVVTVFDQGADGRTLYLAMEYVPGQTLRGLLNSHGPLSPREALDIMDGVLAGLAAAHDAGIAHRDVKPENVLLAGSSTVKVADFGLARLLAAVRQTKSGMIIGTAAYLAPEQVAGATADARSDVYAAGVMLFELLTGRQPHTGDTPLAVAHKHVNEVVPPPSGLMPGLPPALDTLVALATSRDPDLRPGDAGQFLRAASGVRHGLPPDGTAAEAVDGFPVPRGTGFAAPRGTSLSDPPASVMPGGPVAAVPGPPTAADPGGPAIAPPGAPATSMPGEQADGAGPVDTPPAGLVVPSRAWPGAPPDRPGHDLIPGMAPPARQSFGQPRPGSAPASVTQQFRPEPHRSGNQHTLIVSSGTDVPYGQPPRYGPPESRLQRLLFSRRLGYLAAALAVLLVAGLLTWWLTTGRYTTVPKITGMTVAAAKAELRGAGFSVRTGTARLDNHFAKGEVIRSVPASGQRVRKGSQITLIPSAGPHRLQVPQVTGLALQDAQAALRHAGLTPGQVRNETSTTIPAGIVVSTTPAAGALWPQPQPVQLVVSAGPPVPDFVGQPQSAADGWAQANGVSLDVVTVKSDVPAGTIIRQSLPPGSAFTKGQVIKVTVSAGPPTVAIPNVDGLPVDRATHVLEKLGFSVEAHQVGPLDNVFNYSPNGQAPKGSTITLWVGL